MHASLVDLQRNVLSFIKLMFIASLNSLSRYVLLLLQALFGIVLLIHGTHCQQTMCLPHLGNV